MKRINNVLILITGIMLLLISYSFDNKVNLFFKGAKSPLFDAILAIVTNFGVMTTIALLIPSIILYKKRRKYVYLLSFAFAVSSILAFVVKLIVIRQRPMGASTYPFVDIINYSFPSMHAMVIFSLLPLLIQSFQKQKYLWIIYAILIGFSRVYFNVHFLSDVAFGALAGYFIGAYLLNLYEKGKLWEI